MEEVAEVVAEIIEDQAEAVADAVRSLTKLKLGYASLGAAIGGVVASAITYKLVHKQAFKKYSEQAENEISEMREHFQTREEARINAVAKPKLEELVREKGYADPPENPSPSDPVVVNNIREAQAFTEREMAAIEEVEAEVAVEETTQNVFDLAASIPPPEENWDYAKEVPNRRRDHPYVIHLNERGETGINETVTLTYFVGDDTLCNEQDQVMNFKDRERTVGVENLDRFGHGSGDSNTVFIRNEYLEIEFEVVRSEGRFQQEVLSNDGFEHSMTTRIPRRRPRFDDET